MGPPPLDCRFPDRRFFLAGDETFDDEVNGASNVGLRSKRFPNDRVGVDICVVFVVDIVVSVLADDVCIAVSVLLRVLVLVAGEEDEEGAIPRSPSSSAATAPTTGWVVAAVVFATLVLDNTTLDESCCSAVVRRVVMRDAPWSFIVLIMFRVNQSVVCKWKSLGIKNVTSSQPGSGFGIRWFLSYRHSIREYRLLRTNSFGATLPPHPHT